MARSIGKPYGQNAVAGLAKAKETHFFNRTMSYIFKDHTLRIGKSILGHNKRDAMLLYIGLLLGRIPFK